MSSRLDLDAPLVTGVPPGVRRARGQRRALRWRMAAAPLVAAVVVGISAVELARSPLARPAGEAPGPTAELQPPRDAAAGAPDDPAGPAPDPAFPPPRPEPETEQGGAAEPSDAELLAVADEAVQAWGRFASTGDLGEVADRYVADGPQHRQFAAEAADRRAEAEAGGPPYRFTLTEATVLGDQPAGDRLVRGTLELTREGRPAQRYRWDLRLRRVADGSWQVWTVLESSS